MATKNDSTAENRKMKFGTEFPDTVQSSLVIIKNERPDSIEIRESAKKELFYTIKVYGDVDNIDDFIGRINKLKKSIEENVLRRNIKLPDEDSEAFK